SFGCDSLTIIVDNPSSEDATLTFAPSTGEPFDVEVAGGDSATVAFPAAAGLTVDVRYQGASIVHADDPITITPAAFEALTCDEDDAAGGLPAIGGPVALIAGGALLLLGLGAGLFLVARRPRIIFTPGAGAARRGPPPSGARSARSGQTRPVRPSPGTRRAPHPPGW